MASISSILICSGWFFVLIQLEAYRDFIVIGALGLFVIFVAFVILPLGRRDQLRIVDKQHQTRVDERDIIFARARYRPGTAEYEDYYSRHPELKERDEQFRALPKLGEPGGQYFDRLITPIANVSFELLGEIGHLVDGEINQKQVGIDPAEMSQRIKDLARYFGAKLVGITELDRAYIYSHIGRGPGRYGDGIRLDHKYAVVIAVEMEWQTVRAAPGAPTIAESARGYVEAAKIAIIVAKYLRSLGHPARAHIDANYRVVAVPLAWKAGLGELGRMGYLITPQFGPRVRLSIVTTNAPLKTDRPIAFGVQDFCRRCKKCATNCPSGAIPKGGKVVVRGVEKWQMDSERCYTLWRALGTDCALCMRVCPYGHPNSPYHNLIRSAIKRSAVARQLAVWMDDLLYGRKPSK
jgi:ferredoxin